MEYSTKNKVKVLNCLIDNQDKHMSVDEINAYLNNEVPLASLYRIIDSLCKEGLVRKYFIENNIASCYQYNKKGLHNHFHLLCSKCGKIIHLECKEVEHLLSHIEEEHGFAVDISKVNLYGLCDSCREGK